MILLKKKFIPCKNQLFLPDVTDEDIFNYFQGFSRRIHLGDDFLTQEDALLCLVFFEFNEFIK